jgi:hypothetical protein
LITMIAYAFLQHRRLAAASGKRRISADPPQPRLPASRPRSRAPPFRCPHCRGQVTDHSHSKRQRGAGLISMSPRIGNYSGELLIH